MSYVSASGSSCCVSGAHRGGAATRLAQWRVLYVYGENNPVVRCVPRHLWVVSLFKDEKIVNLSAGDSVHWLIESAQVRLAPVVLLKPTTARLATHLASTAELLGWRLCPSRCDAAGTEARLSRCDKVLLGADWISPDRVLAGAPQCATARSALAWRTAAAISFETTVVLPVGASAPYRPVSGAGSQTESR